MLNRLINVISPTQEDQIVFLGDYIDRGKDSRGVVERLIQFKREHPDTIFLRGNHDQLFLDTFVELGMRGADRLRDLSSRFVECSRPSDLEMFLVNGGQETIRSYRVRNLPDIATAYRDHLVFLEETRLSWQHKNFIFAHAGVESGLPLEMQDPYTLLWGRMSKPGADGEVLVVGHHPTTDGEPYFEPGRYNLDTGAVYGKTLTACDVFTREIWQVS